MSELLAVYVDGETKTGKGSASRAIAAGLQAKNLKVHYDVAGDFYRRYTALVRLQLGLGELDMLPTGKVLEAAAQTVYQTRQPFEPNDNLGDLQRPAISQSVSVLAELPLAQKAGGEWWAMTLQLAKKAGADVLVVDGRNPRSRVRDASVTAGVRVQTALDLYMTCDAKEAGRRTLRTEGVASPSHEQLESARQKVQDRRVRDRDRADYPFIVPASALPYDPTQTTPEEIIQKSWKVEGSEPPATVTFNNTYFTEEQMLNAVQSLAVSAIEFCISQPGS